MSRKTGNSEKPAASRAAEEPLRAVAPHRVVPPERGGDALHWVSLIAAGAAHAVLVGWAVWSASAIPGAGGRDVEAVAVDVVLTPVLASAAEEEEVRESGAPARLAEAPGAAEPAARTPTPRQSRTEKEKKENTSEAEPDSGQPGEDGSKAGEGAAPAQSKTALVTPRASERVVPPATNEGAAATDDTPDEAGEEALSSRDTMRAEPGPAGRESEPVPRPSPKPDKADHQARTGNKEQTPQREETERKHAAVPLPVRAPRREQDKPRKRSSSSGGSPARAKRTASTAPAAAAAAPGVVNNYAAKVRARIARARPKGRQGKGTAMIAFALSSSGALKHVRVVRSSGRRDLDRAAVGSVRRAAPFPQPPAAMTARQLSFRIPFYFR